MKILVGFQPDEPVSPLIENLAKDSNAMGGRPTVYLCRQRTCYPPVTDPVELKRLLQD
jgi:uncharacterized protein YyaL (SSP411 family)